MSIPRSGHTCRGLMVLLTGLAAALGFQGAASAAPIPISAPGTLNKAGATYVLTQNVSAPGTAFVIAANGITLDLNGKTVTYNTQPSREPVYGVSLGSPTLWVNITGLKITNGSLVQGAGASPASHAVYLRYGNISNVEISNLTITIHARDCRGIKVAWGNGIEIHHNTITSTVTQITNRHAFDGYAISVATDGPASGVRIHDNRIVGGHGGIDVHTATMVRIYGNDISHRAVDTNGYGIALSSYASAPGIADAQVYGNNIHTDDGVGILVDNQYQNIDIYGNTISVKMRPKPEYGYSYVAWGIKCRTGPEGARFGLRVHDNTITAVTGEGLVNEAAGIGIYDSHSNLNNEYYNNVITVATTSPTKYAAGIINAGNPGADGNPISDSGTRIYNNTITSNNYNIWLAFRDGIGQNALRFSSNTFIRGDNPINYHPIRIGFWNVATENHVLLDTRTTSGVDVDDLDLQGNPGHAYSLYVKWYLDVVVRDASGTPVAGAVITATGQSGSEAVSATTDASGRSRLELTEYFRYGTTYPPTSNYRFYTPHVVTVSKSGYQQYAQTVTVDSTKELVVNLSAASAVSLTKASDCATAAPGEVITYTITYTNNGADPIRDVIVSDHIHPSCTYVPGSVRLNGSPILPDPHADGTLTIVVGTVNPGSGGTITFQARVK